MACCGKCAARWKRDWANPENHVEFFLKHIFFPMLLAGLLSTAAHAAPPPATAQAAQAGIKTCLPAIEKIEVWLARGHAENALAFWDDAAADKNLFSALITLENQAGNNLANLNVVPSSDGQCVVEYTQTGYVAQTCADHLKSLGNGARFVRDLNSKTALIQGQGVQIFLSPAGQGCLWMRKEIIKQPAAATVSQPTAGTKPASKKPQEKTSR